MANSVDSIASENNERTKRMKMIGGENKRKTIVDNGVTSEDE